MMKTAEKIFPQHRSMRCDNRYRVLECIADGLRTRRQIQSAAGLSWGTVSNCVAELEAEQVLCIENTLRKNSCNIVPLQVHGKNSYCYFSGTGNLLAGIFIKSSALELQIITPDLARIHSAKKTIPPFRSVEELLTNIQQLLADSRIPLDRIAALTIALTGAFDRHHNIWNKTSHIPAVENWDLAPLLTLLPERVFFEHDIISKARAVALNTPDAGDDFAFFHFGEGIGLALCRNNCFQEGSRGFAGEIGHLPLLSNENQQNTCLENAASLRGIEIFSRQHNCKNDALACWEYVKPYWIWSAIAAVNFFDPQTLMLGGEALDLFASHLPELPEKIRSQTWMQGPEKILFYQTQDCNTSLGAALSARKHVLKRIADQ